MRKNNILHLFAFCILFLACNQSPKTVERINIKPKILTDSIYLKRIASLICTDNYIFLQDPGERTNFIKAYDFNGVLVSEFGTIGNGPEEFTLPEIIPYKQNSILIWNQYGNFKSAISQEENKFNQKFVTFPMINENNISIQIDQEGNFITYNPNQEKIITLYTPDGKVLASAGELPYPKEISDKAIVYSGKIIYNRYNKKLLLYLNTLPYAAVFKVSKSTIILQKEKILAEKEYTVSENKMEIRERGKDCLVNCCLTKNYIVSILNDPDYKGSDHSQTSPKRHTVGLYDYDLNLVKIVNINMSRYNLASQGNTDDFYAFVQNPENSIVKVEL